MEQMHNQSGMETSFKDVNGKAIKIHDYVKDGNGNRYYINTHCQAVPESGEAPAIELSRLMEESAVTLMTAEEVLEIPNLSATRRRGRAKKQGKNSEEECAAEAQRKAEEEEAAKAQKKAEEEEAAKARAAAAEAAAAACDQPLNPVTLGMILPMLPDNVLAKELRRRGYTLCAFRPALVEL